jgi:hypothetical protein
MGAAARFALHSKPVVALAACLTMAACAAPPPALPPARSGVAATSPADPAACQAVVQDLGRIDADMHTANARIEAERPRNQAIGYFSAVLFPPLLLAAEPNTAERDSITAMYRERDEKLAVAAEMGCQLP